MKRVKLESIDDQYVDKLVTDKTKYDKKAYQVLNSAIDQLVDETDLVKNIYSLDSKIYIDGEEKKLMILVVSHETLGSTINVYGYSDGMYSNILLSLEVVGDIDKRSDELYEVLKDNL